MGLSHCWQSHYHLSHQASPKRRDSKVKYIYIYIPLFKASLVAQLVKNPPAMQETWVRCLGWADPLEKGKATHSSILAWKIPWTL